jgi:phosphate starvation-inducible protein PhoH and related proteins
MGRKNRRSNTESYVDDELYREFNELEEMRKLKVNGSKKIDHQIESIEPITENQKLVFEEYAKGNNLILHGCAGTGKTFITLYLSLCDVIAQNYKKVILVRSVVPTREIGYLPGTLEEKIEVYQMPYVDICRKLFNSEDAYMRLKKRGYIDFVTTSYIRGFTFDDAIIIVDEAENLSFHELDSVITRIGKNCKIVFCGDYQQTDLKGKEKDGFMYFMNIVSGLSSFCRVEFDKDDIVRSALVKEYIIKRDRL